MKMAPLIVAAIALTGCKNAAAKADDEYRFLQGNGASNTELCAAARKAQDAWAEQQNKERYKDAKLSADIACTAARLTP